MQEQNESILKQFLSDRDAPCPKCGYNLRGLQQSTCPECGLEIRLAAVGPDQPFIEQVEWLRMASHPFAILTAATLAMGLAQGPRGAAVVLGGWASVMMFLRLWNWAHRFTNEQGTNPKSRLERRALVYLAYVAWFAASFVVVGAALGR